MIRIILILIFIIIYRASFAQSVGGTTSGTASYCAGNNSGFISLTGQTGNVLFWESSEDQVLWTNLGNPTTSQSYNNLTVTTHYRAIVQDGSFQPDTSTISTITIFVPANGGVISGAGTFCNETGTGTLTLTNFTGNVIDWEISSNGGLNWTSLSNTSTTYNYPNTTQDVSYRVIVENISGCPYDTSEVADITLDALSDAGTITPDTDKCIDGNSGTMAISGYNGSVLNWSIQEGTGSWIDNPSTVDQFSYTDLSITTSYVAIVKNGVCDADTSEISTVTIHNLPTVDAGPDGAVLRYQEFALIGSGNATPSWTPAESLDNPSILSPIATPLFSTMYYLTMTDQYGCSAYDSAFVDVSLPLPNAITPNNDGVNDFFEIEDIENAVTSSLVVFNRQGQEVYSKSPYLNDWYGTNSNNQDLVDGTYFYELIIEDGEPIRGFIIIKR